ncbi:hypothetical protein BGW36DRAFT_411500 [Talaromyces proteolyticus]|uniref:Uncharacterized protein n=1 Tax=Talaromyces proteolyticus TaxID=1131652 RepID=A0AAD4KGN2_9EURO|nr:uncharacterized protein BGW36DRAFT_411500 [Talaromyces proteolyticus]KAH8690695.1 hypothetical protein BGW36DRAFT_411500 [Talaromyces proteolyticus]
MSANTDLPDNTKGYTQKRLNTVRIHKDRGHYDYATVHSITNLTLVSHVAFNVKDEEGDGEDTPINLPLTCVLGSYNPEIDYENISDAQLHSEHQKSMRTGSVEAYLHGNAGSMLYKAIKASEHRSVKVCITSTKVDGVVLVLTPNGHSLNYRSAVIHGTASIVPPEQVAKRRWAMRLLTNHMSPGRWEATYPVAESAMKYVQVIEVQIRTASAKIRASNIGGFDPAVALGQSPGWQHKDIWSGIIPLYEVLGSPISSGVMGAQGESEDALKQVEDWLSRQNEDSKSYAEAAAAVSSVERDLRHQIQKWQASHRQ